MRERVHGRAGRDDVVDDCDVQARKVASDGESAAHAGMPLDRAATDLRGTLAAPKDAARQHADAEQCADGPCNLERLVVAAFAQPPRRERHRHERVDGRGVRRAIARFEHAGREQRAERAAEMPLATILERVKVALERRRIRERRDDRSNGPHVRAPRAACDRGRKAAARTRPHETRQRRDTDRTEARVARGGAARAALRQERVDEAAEFRSRQAHG